VTEPHPLSGPLVAVAELATRLADPSIRVVDCRWVLGQPGVGRQRYEAGHVPGAIFLDVDGDLADPPEVGPGRHPLPDAAAFVARLEAAGIGDAHRVVAYDDVGGWVAARLWWMLDDLGHRSVGVLDGGFPAWVAAGHPVSTEAPDWPPASLDTLRRWWTRTIDGAALAGRLGSVVLLDARGGPRYRGEIEPIDAVPGHIPTARHAPTDSNLRPDGSFLTAAELGERYAALGAGGGDPVVVSCGSGVSACHDALAMRVAGLAPPLLYPGSYSDWTRSGRPVATGAEPGEPPATRG
jgi:thiosulfate/3-mercaptopyruvate sulfurtransferase